VMDKLHSSISLLGPSYVVIPDSVPYGKMLDWLMFDGHNSLFILLSPLYLVVLLLYLVWLTGLVCVSVSE